MELTHCSINCYMGKHSTPTLWQTPAGVLQFNSIPILSPLKQHQILQVKGSVPQYWPKPTPTSDANFKPRLSLAFDPLPVNEKFPLPPPQIQIIHKTQEKSSLTRLTVYHKGHDSGIPELGGRDVQGEGYEEGHRAYMPSGCVHFIALHVSTGLETL